MTEWMAIIFFCLPSGQCQFWASSQSFSNHDSCVAAVFEVNTKMEAEGLRTAPACVRVPKEKAFESNT
jgi:hypothetical protein